jgi:hypothetical protein
MCARIASVLFLLLWVFQSKADTCATRFSELGKFERLKPIQTLFDADERAGLVNESQGSFVVLKSNNDLLTIEFYTSGLFDLYPIERDGPVKFCESKDGIEMIGINRTVEIKIVDGKLIAGKGGPRRTFAHGAMPELLRKLHHTDERGIKFTQIVKGLGS